MRSRSGLLTGLAIVAVAFVLFTAIRTRRDFWDFGVYRTAGVRVLSAEPLYRPDDGHYQFKYWPVFALAMTPFSLLPPVAGSFVWFVLSIFLLRGYLRLSIRAMPDRRSTARWIFWWTLLVCAKFIVKELVNGQTNVLMGLLVLLSALAVERGRPWRAGVLVALAACVKPYALIVVPWLAVTAGAGALAAAGVTLVAGLVVPAAIYGWAGNLAQLRAWYAGVVQTTAPNLSFPENISLATAWSRWVGVGTAASMLAAASAAVLLVLAAAIWWRRSGVERPAYLEAAVLLLLMPLISPQGWDYVLIAALPLFACVVDRLRGDARAWQAAAIAGIFLTSFTVFDLLGRRLYMLLMASSAITIGAAVLAAVAVHLRFRKLA